MHVTLNHLPEGSLSSWPSQNRALKCSMISMAIWSLFIGAFDSTRTDFSLSWSSFLAHGKSFTISLINLVSLTFSEHHAGFLGIEIASVVQTLRRLAPRQQVRVDRGAQDWNPSVSSTCDWIVSPSRTSTGSGAWIFTIEEKLYSSWTLHIPAAMPECIRRGLLLMFRSFENASIVLKENGLSHSMTRRTSEGFSATAKSLRSSVPSESISLAQKFIANSSSFPWHTGTLNIDLFYKSATLRKNSMCRLQYHYAITSGRRMVLKKCIEVQTLAKNLRIFELRALNIKLGIAPGFPPTQLPSLVGFSIAVLVSSIFSRADGKRKDVKSC